MVDRERINAKESRREQTTLGEGLKKLGIELICAHRPRAKGRVDRVNGTLQDRLIKELREEKIRTIDERNRYLEKYRTKLKVWEKSSLTGGCA